MRKRLSIIRVTSLTFFFFSLVLASLHVLWAFMQTPPLSLGGAIIPFILSIAVSLAFYLTLLSVFLKRQILKRQQENTSRLILNQSTGGEATDAYCIVGHQGNLVKVSDSFLNLTYYGNEILGHPASLLYWSNTEKSQAFQGLEEYDEWGGSFYLKRKDGSPLHCELFIIKLPFKDKLYRAFFHPQSAHWKAIPSGSSYDYFTGFPSGGRLENALTQLIQNEIPFRLIYLKDGQLAYTNSIKDRVQYQTLLRKSSSVLLEQLPSSCIPYGIYNGFIAILCQDMDIRIGKWKELLGHCNQNFGLSLIAGLAAFPEDSQNPQDLKACALAAYTRCCQRSDIILGYSEEDNHNIRQDSLMGELKDVIQNKNIFMLYQPLIDVYKNKIVGFEALVRWRREGKEIVPPDEFIPLAERTGLIHPLGEWIIEEAVNFSKSLASIGRNDDIKVGINLSLSQVGASNFLKKLNTLLDKGGIPPSALDLEITESMAPKSLSSLAEITKLLKKRGFSVSIDDFGTGYASMSYLSTLHFDTVKIDKVFVNKIPKDQAGEVFISSILSLTDSLQKATVLEGVETKEQVQRLKEMGCRIMQGYYFSRPLCPKEAILLLQKGLPPLPEN